MQAQGVPWLDLASLYGLKEAGTLSYPFLQQGGLWERGTDLTSGPCPVFSQVIGTLPWVVNSASVAAPAPAQSLQVQAVTPQLLLNAQGQVIATLASSPLPQPVAIRKPSTPESPAKSEVQGLGAGQSPSRLWMVF